MSRLPVATHLYRDSEFGRPAVKLLTNEFYVTREDMVLHTVLGSCVSACIRDAGAGIGGMNHFMLPDGAGDTSRDSSDAVRYGAFAMEVLINELIKGGARRGRMEAKVFGGGAVLKRIRSINVGEENARFVRRFLAMEGIPILAEDLLGEHPRKIYYMPADGRVMVRKLPLEMSGAVREVTGREQEMVDALRAERKARAARAAGAVELFGKPAPRPAPRVEIFTPARAPVRAAVARPVGQPVVEET